MCYSHETEGFLGKDTKLGQFELVFMFMPVNYCTGSLTGVVHASELLAGVVNASKLLAGVVMPVNYSQGWFMPVRDNTNVDFMRRLDFCYIYIVVTDEHSTQ